MATTKTLTEIELHDAPPIPGLRFIAFDMDRDVGGLVEVMVESNLADGVDYLPNAESHRVDLEHTPNLEPARDIILAAIDDRVVGAAQHSIRVRGDTAVHHVDGWVRPAERRRGIGRALLHWTEARARATAATWRGPESHAVTIWPDEDQAGLVALVESEGYGSIRYGFMMLRPLAEPILDAPLPEGLEIRPVRAEDHRRIWDADVEAFEDHWKAAVRTDEDYEGWYASPELDTTLWRVAWDGDEVAGSVMTFVFREENERLGVKRAWLEHVSVRRPWRRRGLAAALITDTLRGLRERGLDEAALGVDAENISGALRLYESLGFRRHRMGICYAKAL
ncbi:MAG TPA: GNAT family N-acetyltransferase [Candidatus Limnocylindrales bacterium]|nr:GNAT family N-acetyltransferase [Candidatus Limnocylindrales bacterium]